MLIRLIPLFMGLFIATAGASDDPLDLPQLGVDTGTVLSIQEEEKIGASFIRGLRRDGIIIEDPVIGDYIQSLGARLANNSDNTRYNFRFYVIRDPSINAFALPAGYICLHSGLIEAVNSESELASVVAHEIAHATQFHIHRAVDKDRRMSAPLTAALITAIVLGAENPQAAELLLTAAMAGKVQSQLNYSRLQEQEADRIGMRMLADTGFDTHAMPEFFATLYRQSRISETAVPEFMRTHPITENRISDSRTRADQYPRRQVADSFAFRLVKTHLQASSAADPAALAKQFSEDLRASPGNRHLRYGLALALTRARNYDKAAKLVDELLHSDQERLPYLLLRANISQQQHKMPLALSQLEAAARLYPDSPYVLNQLAEVLLALNRPQQARNRLRDYLSISQDNVETYKLLGQAEERLGKTGAAYESLAHYHFLEGRFSYAIEHLRQALKQTDLSEHDRSRIQETMAQYQEAYMLDKRQQQGEQQGGDDGDNAGHQASIPYK